MLLLRANAPAVAPRQVKSSNYRRILPAHLSTASKAPLSNRSTQGLKSDIDASQSVPSRQDGASISAVVGVSNARIDNDQEASHINIERPDNHVAEEDPVGTLADHTLHAGTRSLTYDLPATRDEPLPRDSTPKDTDGIIDPASAQGNEGLLRAIEIEIQSTTESMDLTAVDILRLLEEQECICSLHHAWMMRSFRS